MALEMRSEIELCGAESGVALNVRIGIVNTASRMESYGLSGAIQVTERAYQDCLIAMTYAPVEVSMSRAREP